MPGPLFFRQNDTCFLFHAGNLIGYALHIGTHILLRKFQQTFRHCHFRVEIGVQIYTVHAVHGFLPDLTIHLQFPNGVFHMVWMELQQLFCLLHQTFLRQITIPVGCRIGEDIFHCRLYPIGVVRGNTSRCRHFIRHAKTNAPNIICQPIRVMLHHFKSTGFIFLINPHGISGRNVKFLQKQHSFSQFMLFPENLGNPLGFFVGQPFDFRQLFRLFLNDIKRGFSKSVYDLLCNLWANTLDEPRR